MEASSSITEFPREDFDGENDENSIDKLPDAILCHILSFLPTKHAVVTSTLCRRWRYLWTLVPNLHLDDCLLVDWVFNPTHFHEFVDRVLLFHHISCIKRFFLRSVGRHDASLVNAWICAVILQNVEELDLHLSLSALKDVVHLPMSLLTHAKLSVLKLNGPIALHVPQYVRLPNLKVFHLMTPRQLADSCVNKLLFGCPVLEELVIHWASYDANDIRELHIRSSSLKSLSIDRRPFDQGSNGCNTLVMDTPKLEFLELSDHVSDEFKMGELPLLVKACINVRQSESSTKLVSEYAEAVIQLLRQISELKDLHLSFHTINVLRDALGLGYPTFHNLTRLKFGALNEGPPEMMVLTVLECCPTLEILILTEVNAPHAWNTEGIIPQCCLSSLKIIEFLGCTWNGEEMGVIEYFLKNSMCLKKMIIHPKCILSLRVSKYAKLPRRKIRKFTRGSKKCQVVFHDCKNSSPKGQCLG